MKNKLLLVLVLQIINILSESITLAQDQIKSVNNSESYYFKWDEVKCNNPQSSECYKETVCKMWFKANPKNKEIRNCDEFHAREKGFHGALNNYSLYQISKTKPDTVIVTIHGLWGNSLQFQNSIVNLQFVTGKARHSFINLTLPGHMKFDKNEEYLDVVSKSPPFAPFQDWIKALEDTLKLAKLLGKNTIVIGQSTGGLLATYAALKYPNLVDEIVLVEPALQVQDIMNWGACASEWLPMPILNGIGSVIGVPVPKGVNVAMGCEVQKLADQLFQRRKRLITNGSNKPAQFVEDFSVYNKVAEQITIPVLMINNERDQVVSSKANHYFYEGLSSGKKYISINEDGKMPHGWITSVDPYLITDNLLEFTTKFLPENNLKFIYYYRSYKNVKNMTEYFCPSNFELKDCEEIQNDRTQKLSQLKTQVCEILTNDCEQIQKSLDFLYEFWSEHYNYQKNIGHDRHKRTASERALTLAIANTNLPNEIGAEAENRTESEKLRIKQLIWHQDYIRSIATKIYTQFHGD